MAPIELPNEECPAYRDAYPSIDFSRRVVMLESRPVELTSKEFAMLAFLAERAGEILPRRVRKKLGPLGHRYIETVFGSGCRFQPQTAGVRSVA
jgi:DNA-binding response OmpR family regulator